MRKRDGSRGWAIVAAAVCLLVGLGGAEAVAPSAVQTQQPSTPAGAGGVGNQQGGSHPLGVSNTEASIDEAATTRLQHQQEQSNLNERHRRMADDADKLLRMATELKADVDKSTKNETSVSAYNKADAIERLAHDVKQRLRN